MKKMIYQKKRPFIFEFACALFLLLAFVSPNNVSAQTKLPAAPSQRLEVWKSFNLGNGSFKVDFPAEPEQSSFVTATEQTVYVSAFKTDYSFYAALWGTLPKIEYNENEKRDIFQDILANLGEFYKNKLGEQGAVLSEKDMTRGGVPGREFKLLYGASLLTVQTFYSQNKAYTLIVGTPFLHNAPAEIVKIYESETNKFFNSFQLSYNKTLTATSKGKAN